MIALAEVMSEESGNRHSPLTTGVFGNKLNALHVTLLSCLNYRFSSSRGIAKEKTGIRRRVYVHGATDNGNGVDITYSLTAQDSPLPLPEVRKGLPYRYTR
jgi:hypothetical protein